jgi:hypothetical protein
LGSSLSCQCAASAWVSSSLSMIITFAETIGIQAAIVRNIPIFIVRYHLQQCK